MRELQAIIDGLTGKDPATEDTWRKVVGSRHVLVVPPEDSFADVFAGLVTEDSRPSRRSTHSHSGFKDEQPPKSKTNRGVERENPTKGARRRILTRLSPRPAIGKLSRTNRAKAPLNCQRRRGGGGDDHAVYFENDTPGSVAEDGRSGLVLLRAGLVELRVRSEEI